MEGKRTEEERDAWERWEAWEERDGKEEAWCKRRREGRESI